MLSLKLLLTGMLTGFVLAQAEPVGEVSLEDKLFLQETGHKVNSPEPLTAVAVINQTVFAGTAKGLLKLEGTEWRAVPELTNGVFRLKTVGTNGWALTVNGPFILRGTRWERAGNERIADVTEHRGEILVALDKKVARFQNGTNVVIGTNECPFPITRILSHNSSIFVHGSGRLTIFELGRFGGRDLYDDKVDQTWDWGNLPSKTTRDAVSSGARLLIATDRGLGLLRGMSLTSIGGPEGLPYEDTWCLANGFANDLWIGTSRGAIRQVGEAFHYFSGQRWLPNEKVNAIALEGHKVYLATDGGLGVIEYVPFTLASKAAFYEKHLEEWGQKRLGLVQKLEWDDALGEFVREAGDNDGGYTGDYLAAQSYRYAVTGDPAARAEAVNTFQTLRWLRTMTGIPGFIARAIWVPGEVGHKATGGSGGYPAEWHPTPDGKYEWKGDTSSDELCSHFYAVGIFLDLAAQGKEKEQAREHLTSMATHLIDHQWQLIDVDGKPTRWGRWYPDYFLSDEGKFDRGLQCLEILSFMKMAETVAPDNRAKFTQAYAKLVDLGYPAHTLRQKNTFPPESLSHFIDQLALGSYWNLLRNETNPDLLSLYRRSFERTWETLRVEQQPWHNFIYAALTGNRNDAELGAAVTHLREWPLDLRIWSYQNSHRADLRTPKGYVSLAGGIRVFSPREREPMRWDGWTMKDDGGAGGRDVVEPSSWLLAYWMGRYYGFIKPPKLGLQTAEVATVPRGVKGARPYTGPARPALP